MANVRPRLWLKDEVDECRGQAGQDTSIHAARLHVEGDALVCTRDLDAPVHLAPALLDD
ncbi:hypothetical protein ACFVWT_10935 [Arthrobacter sp. NPDC058288]|uniref:hypothetical protein n=1 Tax=Arthrobacter sp. NPDC058288 TaxID=3346424 RepID=UPI0036F15003